MLIMCFTDDDTVNKVPLTKFLKDEWIEDW
jgi:hypothetical protein